MYTCTCIHAKYFENKGVNLILNSNDMREYECPKMLLYVFNIYSQFQPL